MFSRSTWRAVVQIPLIKSNYDAIRVLNSSFYLLLALYRTRRFRDFERLQRLYFRMLESFAQYGRAEAEDTLNQLISIPWFSSRKRQVYELIAIYRRITEVLPELESSAPDSGERQAEFNSQVAKFIAKFKELNEFGPQDEARVRALIEDRDVMDEMVNAFFDSLEGSYR